jgi:hypothetical protein
MRRLFTFIVLVVYLSCSPFLKAQDDLFAEKVDFLYNQYMNNNATNINVLIEEFDDSQINYMPMICMLPSYTNNLGLRVFKPSDFSTGFNKDLIAITKNKVDVYPVYIEEDSKAERVFYNVEGKEIARYKHSEDYTDSSWYLKNYMLNTYEACSTKDEYLYALEMYNPIKYIEVVNLIESTNLVTYLAYELNNIPQVPAAPIKSSALVVSNIVLSINASDNTNTPLYKTLTVQYLPDNIETNACTIYTTTNLLDGWSRLCITNLSLATNVFYYLETDTNSVQKYYKLHVNIDTDLDGIFDGDEKLIYRTNYLDSDSDNDFIPDKWELDNNFDPLSITDAFGDADKDMLPNSYEYFYNLNPHTNDSWQITKLRVDPDNTELPNTYETIQDAFNASTNYSVIEVAEGVYNLGKSEGIIFPSHPVMLMSDNWGTNRLTIIDYYDDWSAAFVLSDAQDSRTVIRGLTIRLKNSVSDYFQMAISLGGWFNYSAGATPFLDGVGIVLGINSYSYGLYCFGSNATDLFVNNCYFAGAGNLSTKYYGIISFGGYNLNVFNSTFMNFETSIYSAGIHLDPTLYYSNNPEPYTLYCNTLNSVWDESFDIVNRNIHAIRCFQSTNRMCDVALYNSIMPVVWTNTVFEVEDSLTITNLDFNNSYYLPSNSICINNSGTNVLTWYDFEGKERSSSSDIGVDEFYGDNQSDRDNDGLSDVVETIIYMSSPFDIDTDGDGLTDLQEANTYTTLLYKVDTDGDNVSDYDEVHNNTDPLNPSNYYFQITGSVTNETFYKKSPYYISYSFEDNVWNTNNVLNISDTNSYNYLVRVESSAVVYLQTLYDFNTNGLVDELEPFSNVEATIVDCVFESNCKLTMADFDKGDCDGMADLWEKLYGLCWTNALDVYDDPDHDGIDNGWEHDLIHDPNVSNTYNYAIIAARNSIIPRLENKNPTNALCLFVNPYVDPIPTNYVRNTNCWTGDIDLTALSPWNSRSAHSRAGVLISPIHVIFAAHHVPLDDSVMHFVDNDNVLYERDLVNIIEHHDWDPDELYPDIAIGILDEELPTNKFSLVSFLPDDYSNYIKPGNRLHAIKFDQEEKALYTNVSFIEKVGEYEGIYTAFYPASKYMEFYEHLGSGDSSNPGIIVLNNIVVLLVVWTSPGQGTSLTYFKEDINYMMEELSNYVGITNGYQIKEINLSEFEELPEIESR